MKEVRMITINGLTKRQKRMLDTMWALDTEEEFFEWYHTLSQLMQQEADLLQRMIIIESAEEDLKDLTQANQLLKQFQLSS
jgi:hypothetical protein